MTTPPPMTAPGLRDLLPCPFCGSDTTGVENERDFKDVFWRVTCLDCGAQSRETPTRDSAVQKWNTRTPAPIREATTDDMVERAAQYIADHRMGTYLGWDDLNKTARGMCRIEARELLTAALETPHAARASREGEL